MNMIVINQFLILSRGEIVRKIYVSVLLVLIFFCRTALSMTAQECFLNAQALWNEGTGKFTDPQKAIDYLNQAIKLHPGYAMAYNSRGNAYADLGKYRMAIEDYNRAIRLKPDYVPAYVNRGDAYFGLGMYQRSIEDCSKAIRLKPDNAVAFSNRGKAYAKKGRYQPAIDDFNEAIRLHPDDINAYNNRAITYLLRGNKDSGCGDARKTCAMGLCQALEWAQRKGYCPREQPFKATQNGANAPTSDASMLKNPVKPFHLPIKIFNSPMEDGPGYEKIKGIELMNGKVIEGQIISMNSSIIRIRIGDGRILSFSFEKDVKRFIKD